MVAWSHAFKENVTAAEVCGRTKFFYFLTSRKHRKRDCLILAPAFIPSGL